LNEFTEKKRRATMGVVCARAPTEMLTVNMAPSVLLVLLLLVLLLLLLLVFLVFSHCFASASRDP
jgi:hypothetical protein